MKFVPPLVTYERSALAGDLALCATFLELDGRNFHCWAHRMWVAERMGLSAREEFDFTTEKIKQVRKETAGRLVARKQQLNSSRPRTLRVARSTTYARPACCVLVGGSLP